MAKEDLLLREEMGRLEIEPMKFIEANNENPFNISRRRGLPKRHYIQNAVCDCTFQKRNANTAISKKKKKVYNNKILREPVLQIVKNSLNKVQCQQECNCTHENCSIESLNLCTLVKTCNQLKISNDSKQLNSASTSSSENKWWKKFRSSSSHSSENREIIQHTQTASCSQQALNPPCDITIDELASYFETLVHIPKKMSSMAEMMYI